MELFKDVGWVDQDNLVGVKDEDVDAICKVDTLVPVKTLMRAAARQANLAFQARASVSGSASSTRPEQSHDTPRHQNFASPTQVQEIVGAERSAAVLAKL